MAPVRSLQILFAALLGAAAVSAKEAEYDAGIKVTDQFAANTTDHPTGWYLTDACSGPFCAWANRDIGNGRGVVMIGAGSYVDVVRQWETNMIQPESNATPDPSQLEFTADGSIVAKKPLRRGTRLLTRTPVFIVPKRVFHIEEEEQYRLLEEALAHLPDATREQFFAHATTKERGGAAIKAVVLAVPFEADFSFGRDSEDGDHYLNYPEAAQFAKDCRPNTVFSIHPGSGTWGAATVRKVAKGERLSITVMDPLSYACTDGIANTEESEANLEKILKMEEELKKELPTVTAASIAAYLGLYKIERLEARLAHAYELAAYNFNYIGDDKWAKKYAELARQAWMLEDGPESNMAVAMGVLANHPTEHYSYKWLEKRGR